MNCKKFFVLQLLHITFPLVSPAHMYLLVCLKIAHPGSGTSNYSNEKYLHMIIIHNICISIYKPNLLLIIVKPVKPPKGKMEHGHHRQVVYIWRLP